MVIIQITHHLLFRYLWDVRPYGICIIMKALKGFLTIQEQMILKCYNVWKLHRPRMSHGLLAENVDTTLASLLYNRCGVQWSARSVSEPWKTWVADALSLCGSWASCSHNLHLFLSVCNSVGPGTHAQRSYTSILNCEVLCSIGLSVDRRYKIVSRVTVYSIQRSPAGPAYTHRD